MSSIERVQTKMTCTPAELESWARRARADEMIEIAAHVIHTGLRRLPPCMGCDAPVSECPEGALMVDTVAQTATFRPCGCVLAIVKSPERPLRGEEQQP